MNKFVEAFPEQLEAALAIGQTFAWQPDPGSFQQVLLSGLGGSGIGGSIVQEYLSDKCALPFFVNKDYAIPRWVNAQTLFIACSYSGDTEETLQAVALAKKQKATIVCITSGGLLEQYAHRHQLPLILIPGGMPPRSCIGYALVQVLFVLKRAGLLRTAFEKEIAATARELKLAQKQIQKKAKTIASKLYGKIPVIYTPASHEGLAIRFRQQLNENSKVLAWHHVLPEMTHNEIVGWRQPHENIAVLFCYAPSDYERTLRRMTFLKKTIKPYNASLIDLLLEGDHYWDMVFRFIHLTDWISVYLSELNQVDAVEVKVILSLKKEMSRK